MGSTWKKNICQMCGPNSWNWQWANTAHCQWLRGSQISPLGRSFFVAKVFQVHFGLVWVGSELKALKKCPKKRKAIDLFLLGLYLKAAGMLPNKWLGPSQGTVFQGLCFICFEPLPLPSHPRFQRAARSRARKLQRPEKVRIPLGEMAEEPSHASGWAKVLNPTLEESAEPPSSL